MKYFVVIRLKSIEFLQDFWYFKAHCLETWIKGDNLR